MRAAALTLISLVAGPAAGDISLVQPIDCTLDQDCYLQQFVDIDSGPGVRDFACGTLSYDGHKGTDFALPTLSALATGVNVLAAANGTVRGIRNDMVDVLQGTANAPDVSNRECGNGVVLIHADGYETQYCHMKKGSITVTAGDTVSAGDILGQVGLSGQTEFPHLHLSVRRNGAVVDPFDPDGAITCGMIDDETLWSTNLPTPAGGIISQGWSNRVPDFAAIKAGTAAVANLTPTDALVAWVHLFGTQTGDRLAVQLTGPLGEVLRDTVSLDRTQAQAFRALGKRAPDSGWTTGAYTARFDHLRGDTTIDTVTFTIQVRD